MAVCGTFQFGLVCLIMAAFTGLAGFVIIYHYATSERPLEQFAIVIDAGSTQTRSSLFTISVDAEKMIDWSSEIEESSEKSSDQQQQTAFSLSKVIQVKEISSCVNGGPLAALKSEDGAKKLIDTCSKKFARKIRKLDFMNTETDDADDLDWFSDEALSSSNDDELVKRLAMLNHRVNSLTHMHLGATAGMRALSMINKTRATEKLDWINKAIDASNEILTLGPFINKGYVDILTGADEAAFGWSSVNFVCDRLKLQRRSATNLNNNNNNQFYQIGDHQLNEKGSNVEQQLSSKLPESVGTVELGGASSQIAYQVPSWWSDEDVSRKGSMDSKNLNLFDTNYKLATRSDLCLGMSQATLRVKFILLRDYYNQLSSIKRTEKLIKIINPCFQNQSETNLSSSDMSDILRAPCLANSELDYYGELFKASINNTKNQDTIYQFVGTGNTEQCDILLNKLLDPNICKQYFSLCPKKVDHQSMKPPANMSFVTISGYNKALQVLNLDKRQIYSDAGRKKLDDLIGEKLGGYSIDHSQFIDESKKFCALDVDTFSKKYPKLHKVYYPINCMQLVYINKLLTEFYLFDAQTRWHQLKFLLFSATDSNNDNHISKNDIGWTLGLLLNATSHQFSGDQVDTENSIIYHHGASIVFIMRTTLLLMLGCLLIAISLIVSAIFAVRHRTKKRSAYIDHSHDEIVPTTPDV